MILSPKESGQYIASNASFVSIDKAKIKNLGDTIIQELNSKATSNFSQTDVHPSKEDPWALDWLIIIDTLNFCFWHKENETGWCVEGYTGYFALCAAINRVVKNDPNFLKPSYYSKITEKQLEDILKSDNNVTIPLLSERVECLRQVGKVLMEKFDGSFENLVKQSNQSAIKLLDLIVNNFDCFKDEALYKGVKVSLYKRAQILVGDIWACFQNEGIGHFNDIEQITMFADYRVPQTLIYFNILKYSNELIDKMNEDTLLMNGDVEEVEIRGCSIHAVELLTDYIKSKLPESSINSITIDHFLWDFRRKHAKAIILKKIPFHKTISIYY